MQDVTLIGIDLGKHSFHVHGQDRQGKELLRKKFSRKQLIEFLANFHPCTVVMEACAGAHHMARQLAGFGHEPKLISPQFVRPFVKSNKIDFIDAEAICEAACRPSMRFVTPKTESQQCLSALRRVRESLVRERTRTSNQIHGFLLEFGISLPVGHAVIRRLPSVLAEQALPARLVALLERLHSHFKYLHAAPGAPDRPHGEVGALNADAASLECRGLRPGQQAGTNRLGDRRPPYRIQTTRGRHGGMTAS